MSDPLVTPNRRFPDANNPDDNLKIPRKDGDAPRPATEPDHAEGQSDTDKTLTDPATGLPGPGGKGRAGPSPHGA
ncbi:MAG: hypothetical protein JO111_10745 [Caulobacteraceae bacterium]|nr:hypothetical protein [Caulobacteraceae bacterium]